MPCDELNKSISARSNDVKDPTSYAGNMLSINFSGGLFGVDKLPHSTDGHALYTSTYTYSNDSSESDNIYIIKSEFGVNDDHAAKVLNAAKKLPKNEYLLLVAER